MAKALGPQKVHVFNTADDTRLAFICVAADYKMKRIALGIEEAPVPGIGAAVDNSRGAASRIWFETMYEPLLATEDGTAFELRGQRLQVKAGEEPFDPKGATRRADAFAKEFTKKMPQLCTVVPLFADLQNLADLAVVATLIRTDRLDEKTHWENIARVRAPIGWPVAKFPVTNKAETLVNYVNGSIAAGGVSLSCIELVDKEKRKIDAKGTLTAPRDAAKKELADSPTPVIKPSAP
jgi:hypothetical protein